MLEALHLDHFDEVWLWLMEGHLAPYVAASNFGVASVYFIIMIGTVRGFSLPRASRIGSRNFFFGCASAHIIMAFSALLLVHAVLRPSHWVALFDLAMLAVNLQQIGGGYTTIIQVKWREINEIRFGPGANPED